MGKLSDRVGHDLRAVAAKLLGPNDLYAAPEQYGHSDKSMKPFDVRVYWALLKTKHELAKVLFTAQADDVGELFPRVHKLGQIDQLN